MTRRINTWGWRERERQRRGTAVVAVIVSMLILSIIVVGSVLGTARDQDLTVRRLETVRAFYAAEAGANMAIRELILNTDADGDGAIGSISNDGNSANDPTLSAAQVSVTRVVSGPQVILTSRGRSGQAQRAIETTMQ
jgi:Tfp pilus assembly protein PilX